MNGFDDSLKWKLWCLTVSNELFQGLQCGSRPPRKEHGCKLSCQEEYWPGDWHLLAAFCAWVRCPTILDDIAGLVRLHMISAASAANWAFFVLFAWAFDPHCTQKKKKNRLRRWAMSQAIHRVEFQYKVFSSYESFLQFLSTIQAKTWENMRCMIVFYSSMFRCEGD